MTQEDRTVSGVYIHGHNLGAAAGGTGAAAVQHLGSTPAATPLADVLAALAGLRKAIEDEPDLVRDSTLALRDVGRIESEVREEKPDREAIVSGFGRLLGRAGAAAGVVTAIYNVKRLVGDLLS